MKKILVLGATGMAGHLITLYFKEKGYDVTGFCRREVKEFNTIIGDALETQFLKKAILDGNYDVIINCIGILNQDAENNKSIAVSLNSHLPHFIADITKDSSTKLIQMSTDCVFAGNTGPYFEDSLPDGATFYDRSKALGEIDDDKNLTFRNSIIGPDWNENGIGLFHWFMKQQGVVNGFTGAIWTGVTTLTLAKAMEQAIEQDLTGLYNLVNNESISKYDLLLSFNKHFRNDSITVNAHDSLKLDKSLRRKRTDFNFIVPSYEQMIVEMKEWIDNHKEIYPSYYFNA